MKVNGVRRNRSYRLEPMRETTDKRLNKRLIGMFFEQGKKTRNRNRRRDSK